MKNLSKTFISMLVVMGGISLGQMTSHAMKKAVQETAPIAQASGNTTGVTNQSLSGNGNPVAADTGSTAPSTSDDEGATTTGSEDLAAPSTSDDEGATTTGSEDLTDPSTSDDEGATSPPTATEGSDNSSHSNFWTRTWGAAMSWLKGSAQEIPKAMISPDWRYEEKILRKGDPLILYDMSENLVSMWDAFRKVVNSNYESMPEDVKNYIYEYFIGEEFRCHEDADDQKKSAILNQLSKSMDTMMQLGADFRFQVSNLSSCCNKEEVDLEAMLKTPVMVINPWAKGLMQDQPITIENVQGKICTIFKDSCKIRLNNAKSFFEGLAMMKVQQGVVIDPDFVNNIIKQMEKRWKAINKMKFFCLKQSSDCDVLSPSVKTCNTLFENLKKKVVIPLFNLNPERKGGVKDKIERFNIVIGNFDAFAGSSSMSREDANSDDIRIQERSSLLNIVHQFREIFGSQSPAYGIGLSKIGNILGQLIATCEVPKDKLGELNEIRSELERAMSDMSVRRALITVDSWFEMYQPRSSVEAANVVCEIEHVNNQRKGFIKFFEVPSVGMEKTIAGNKVLAGAMCDWLFHLGQTFLNREEMINARRELENRKEMVKSYLEISERRRVEIQQEIENWQKADAEAENRITMLCEKFKDASITTEEQDELRALTEQRQDGKRANEERELNLKKISSDIAELNAELSKLEHKITCIQNFIETIEAGNKMCIDGKVKFLFDATTCQEILVSNNASRSPSPIEDSAASVATVPLSAKDVKALRKLNIFDVNRIFVEQMKPVIDALDNVLCGWDIWDVSKHRCNAVLDAIGSVDRSKMGGDYQSYFESIQANVEEYQKFLDKLYEDVYIPFCDCLSSFLPDVQLSSAIHNVRDLYIAASGVNKAILALPKDASCLNAMKQLVEKNAFLQYMMWSKLCNDSKFSPSVRTEDPVMRFATQMDSDFRVQFTQRLPRATMAVEEMQKWLMNLNKDLDQVETVDALSAAVNNYNRLATRKFDEDLSFIERGALGFGESPIGLLRNLAWEPYEQKYLLNIPADISADDVSEVRDLLREQVNSMLFDIEKFLNRIEELTQLANHLVDNRPAELVVQINYWVDKCYDSQK